MPSHEAACFTREHDEAPDSCPSAGPTEPPADADGPDVSQCFCARGCCPLTGVCTSTPLAQAAAAGLVQIDRVGWGFG